MLEHRREAWDWWEATTALKEERSGGRKAFDGDGDGDGGYGCTCTIGC